MAEIARIITEKMDELDILEYEKPSEEFEAVKRELKRLQVQIVAIPKIERTPENTKYNQLLLEKEFTVEQGKEAIGKIKKIEKLSAEITELKKKIQPLHTQYMGARAEQQKLQKAIQKGNEIFDLEQSIRNVKRSQTKHGQEHPSDKSDKPARYIKLISNKEEALKKLQKELATMTKGGRRRYSLRKKRKTLLARRKTLALARRKTLRYGRRKAGTRKRA
jgi:hypothetical protein